MGSRGVHFAIRPEKMSRLLQARTDKDLLSIIQDEIEEEWDKEWLYQTDKAWDAIHRSVTEGQPQFDNGPLPHNAAILGGEPLYRGDDCTVSLVRPDSVGAVAHALARVDKQALREGYSKIAQSDYQGVISDEDFEYTWDWFDGLAGFFQRAAEDGRAVIFTVDL